MKVLAMDIGCLLYTSYTAPVFYANGTAAAEPVTKPTLPGYSFDGWYLDKDCTNPANFSEITTSTTVYAGWEAANTTYTVIHWQENADDKDVYKRQGHGVAQGIDHAVAEGTVAGQRIAAANAA